MKDYSRLLDTFWNSASRTYSSSLRDRRLPDFASGHRSFQFEIVIHLGFFGAFFTPNRQANVVA